MNYVQFVKQASSHDNKTMLHLIDFIIIEDFWCAVCIRVTSMSSSFYFVLCCFAVK
jgi:hypothetical protein